MQTRKQASQEDSPQAAQVAQVLQLVLQQGFADGLQTVCTYAQVSTACRAAVQQARSDFGFTSTDKESDIRRQLSTFLSFAAWLPRYPGILRQMELQLGTHPQGVQIAHALTGALAKCAAPAEHAATSCAAAVDTGRGGTTAGGQHFHQISVPLKLAMFEADGQLANASVLQSLNTCLWGCYLQNFNICQVTPVFCVALTRFTALYDLRLVPQHGALPTAAVAALAQLSTLRHLELAIEPAAARLLPASLQLLTIILTETSETAGGGSYSSQALSTAASSSSASTIVDVSHISALMELQSRAPGGGRFTIKPKDFVVTVGADHPVRYLAAAKPTSSSSSGNHSARQSAGPSAAPPAPAAATSREHGLKSLYLALVMPQAEDLAVLQDLQLAELSELRLWLGYSGADRVQLERAPQHQLQLQQAAASFSRCTTIRSLFLSVSGQEEITFLGSIPWCRNIAQLKRLQKLDLSMDWMEPDEILQLSVLTSLTCLAPC